MYKKVLQIEPEWLDNFERAQRKKFLPTVLSIDEVREILNKMSGMTRLMAALIYNWYEVLNSQSIAVIFSSINKLLTIIQLNTTDQYERLVASYLKVV